MATTEGKIVVCPQCGKKYKLKAGFAAASFACTGCSATVWVEGKPAAAAPTSKRSGGGGSKRRAGGRSGGARGKTRASAAATGGRRRGRREPEEDEAGEGRRSRYQQPKNNTNVIIAVAGLLIVVVAVIVILVMSNKKEPPPIPPVAQGNPAATTGDTGDGDAMNTTDDGAASAATPISNQNPAAGSGGDESAAGTDDGSASTDDGAEAAPTATRKLGGSSTKRGELRSRYDPPADLGHLEDTPPELRKQIDDLIKNLMDPMAGRDSLEAKDKLVAIGKPAFPVILGKMALIRDTITDVDSQDERDTESSLKLADEALREMDGYLTANNKSTLRPGSHKEYIAYICRLHYKRWMTTLKDMPKMPGPFDPTQEYAAEDEDYKGK